MQFDNFCPCRDKMTGLCYGRLWFLGKSAKPIACPGDCGPRRTWQAAEQDIKNKKQTGDKKS